MNIMFALWEELKPIGICQNYEVLHAAGYAGG